MKKRAKFSSAGESVVVTASLITACCVPQRIVTALRSAAAGTAARAASMPVLPPAPLSSPHSNRFPLSSSSSSPKVADKDRGGEAAAAAAAAAEVPSQCGAGANSSPSSSSS